jgi:hypothetical protein
VLGTSPADRDQLLGDSIAGAVQANQCIIRVRLLGLRKRFDAYAAEIYLFNSFTVLVLQIANYVSNTGAYSLSSLRFVANGKFCGICVVSPCPC